MYRDLGRFYDTLHPLGRRGGYHSGRAHGTPYIAGSLAMCCPCGDLVPPRAYGEGVSVCGPDGCAPLICVPMLLLAWEREPVPGLELAGEVTWCWPP